MSIFRNSSCIIICKTVRDCRGTNIAGAVK